MQSANSANTTKIVPFQKGRINIGVKGSSPRQTLLPGWRSLLCVALLVISVTSSKADLGARRFEARDAVEMSYFGNSQSSQPIELDDDGILSPDGRWLVKITHRGVMSPEGVTEGTIWLFDAVSIRQALNKFGAASAAPQPLARLSASVNGIEFVADRGNTISQILWMPDSRHLAFLGRDHQENRRLSVVDIYTHSLVALTPPDQDVVSYAITHEGFLYFAAADREEEQEWWSTGPGIPDIEIGTGKSLIQLLYPHWTGNRCCGPLMLKLWQVRGGEVRPVLTEAGTAVQVVTRYGAQLMSVSPDERTLAIIASRVSAQAGSDDHLVYTLVSLKTGHAEPIAGTSIVPNSEGYVGGRYRAVWSGDGQRLAISLIDDASNPMDVTDRSKKTCVAAVVNLEEHRTQCALESGRLAGVDGLLYTLIWGRSADQLSLRYRRWRDSLYEDEVLTHGHDGWRLRALHVTPNGLSLQLTIKQGLNDPPLLLATDPSSHRSRVIFDPNPQLKEVALGSASVYAWNDRHGRRINGVLALPPGVGKGHRYPLVIQTHGFDGNSFFRVGYGETANAGRAFLSRDIAVLQVGEPFEPYYRTWEAAKENGTDVYLAAIDQLASEDIIDPTKVGITGYSAKGLFVTHSLVQEPRRFRAAALSNTDPGSLTDYYTYIDYGNPELAALDAQVVAGGAKPYGQGLRDWLARAPEFSTDKIETPILFSPATPHDLIEEWSFYAALKDQGKPVDLQYMRSGQHNLSKPLQRYAQQEMLVDWFDFWLNGHEESNSGKDKSEQYLRWRMLRKLQMGAP